MIPHLAPDKVILVAGDYDRVAPAEEIEHLSRLWGGTHYASFRQGHVGYKLMPESFRMAQRLWPEEFALVK
jgi:poly(3-hydroxyalkanoate) synthetase